MCLLILKPAGIDLPNDVLENGHSSNRDGFGLAFPDPDTKRVTIIKGLFPIDKIKWLYDRYRDYPLMIHFRLATSGEVSNENSHPYRILDLEKDGRDLFMAHNGVLGRVRGDPRGKKGGRSDTRELCEEYLRPLLKKDPGLIDKPDFQTLLGDAVGSGNKFVLMDGEGKVIFINKSSGQEENGVWYSNSGFKWGRGSYYGDWYC